MNNKKILKMYIKEVLNGFNKASSIGRDRAQGNIRWGDTISAERNKSILDDYDEEEQREKQNKNKSIKEAAKSGKETIESDLALVRKQNGSRYFYVLYNPNVFAEVVKDPGFRSMRFKAKIEDFIVGFVEALPHSGDCCDAMEIKRSAAQKGYGPLLYDIVMSDGEGGLMPDRISTSDQAKNIWKFYSNKRSDVEKKELDDEDNPKTPDKGDDCTIVKDNDDVLNYAYEGPGDSGSKSSLISKHNEFINSDVKNTVSSNALENYLIKFGETFFDQKYGN